MIDPMSVEGMLNEEPRIHFPVELLVKLENYDGSPTGEEKIVIICGCDMRYSYAIGHEGEEDTSFIDLIAYAKDHDESSIPDFKDFTEDPKSEIW